MFWTKKKKKKEVVFSVSNSELCCRLSVLFGLCVAVFCQHEILSPLEDFRGGRATSPGFWRRLWFPRTSGESWVLTGALVGMFDLGLFESSLIMRCLLGPFLHSCCPRDR